MDSENSTQTAQGVPLIAASAPTRRSPFAVRYAVAPARDISTGGASTAFDRSVHTPPPLLPTFTEAPLPTRRLSASPMGEATRGRRTTTKPELVRGSRSSVVTSESTVVTASVNRVSRYVWNLPIPAAEGIDPAGSACSAPGGTASESTRSPA